MSAERGIAPSLEGRRIVVAGAHGFIGRSFIARAIGCGARVLAIDLKPGPGSFDSERVECLYGGLSEIQARIPEAAKLKGGGDLLVCNFAGIASAPACAERPGAAYEANVQYALELARIATRLGARRYVYPSTGYVYGDRLAKPAAEGDPCRPESVYVNTKIAAECLLSAVALAEGLGLDIVRPSNVYGLGSSPDSVIGTIIQQAMAREPIRVRSHAPVRDFLYVDDLVDAFIDLCGGERDPGPETYNVSTGRGVSIGALARAAGEIWGLPVVAPEDPNPTSSFLVLDNGKIRQALAWEPKRSLEEGLAAIHGGFHGKA